MVDKWRFSWNKVWILLLWDPGYSGRRSSSGCTGSCSETPTTQYIIYNIKRDVRKLVYLPKNDSPSNFHHQWPDPGIDPIQSHPRIQCSWPLQRDSHTEPASEHVLTPSRVRIWIPLPIARQQRPWHTPNQDVTYVIRESHPELPRARFFKKKDQNIPPPRTTWSCSHTMGQNYPLTGPVRGLTRPSIPPPFHWREEKYPETSSEKTCNFFPFFKRGTFSPSHSVSRLGPYWSWTGLVINNNSLNPLIENRVGLSIIDW
jgi:hypothetical protein